MSTQDGGPGQEPAFPSSTDRADEGFVGYFGISARDYACIHLKVPETGKDWLDAIITKAERRELAAAALTGLLSHSGGLLDSQLYRLVEHAYDCADACLREKEKRP